MNYEYVFRDRWVLAGSPAKVYAALSDFNLYPLWGYPGYLYGRRDGELAVGCKGKLTVQGGLPYKINFDVELSKLLPDREIEVIVGGDVTGIKKWLINPMPGGGTELISDWRCNVNWAFLKVMTPLIKPVFRWNHAQCLNTA